MGGFGCAQVPSACGCYYDHKELLPFILANLDKAQHICDFLALKNIAVHLNLTNTAKSLKPFGRLKMDI